MKTILYQPLFINPQAYFVFPQLYHIEKGDSYIEPANITGQLIINDLTKVLTSTPTLNVVQDTNQVDFGLFKGKLNSGVGIYAQDFKNWSYGSTINKDISTKSYNKFHIVKKKADNWFGFTIGIPKNNYYNQSYKLKFNINKKIDDIKFSIVSTDGNLITTAAYSVYINDGSIIDVPIISEEIFNNKEETNIYYDFGTNKDIEIDVELIANYPNQLCYDGKSYAVAYGLPILTDYTIIADRTWFKDKVKSWSYFIDKSKAFVFERTNNGNNFSAKSFAAETSINIEENNVSYQTKTSYNGNIINYHSDQSDNDDRLVIGSTKDLLGYQCFIGCHGDILLFNRTLTEYEISWVKNNMMCSKQQEPDIDL